MENQEAWALATERAAKRRMDGLMVEVRGRK